MIPMMLPMLFIAPLVPNVVKKFGSRFVISAGLFLASIAFLIMSFWTKDMTYWQLFGTMIIMMVGIVFAMTPGTNILMASVPRNRSGMGSAMNDTTRELGSALGVAILGAILSSTYSKQIHDVAMQFGGAISEGLKSSLAVALQVADKLGPSAASVANAAKDAFMGGITHAALIGSAIIFVAAAIALFGLPKHSKKNDDVI